MVTLDHVYIHTGSYFLILQHSWLWRSQLLESFFIFCHPLLSALVSPLIDQSLTGVFIWFFIWELVTDVIESSTDWLWYDIRGSPNDDSSRSGFNLWINKWIAQKIPPTDYHSHTDAQRPFALSKLPFIACTNLPLHSYSQSMKYLWKSISDHWDSVSMIMENMSWNLNSDLHHVVIVH